MIFEFEFERTSRKHGFIILNLFCVIIKENNKACRPQNDWGIFVTLYVVNCTAFTIVSYDFIILKLYHKFENYINMILYNLYFIIIFYPYLSVWWRWVTGGRGAWPWLHWQRCSSLPKASQVNSGTSRNPPRTQDQQDLFIAFENKICLWGIPGKIKFLGSLHKFCILIPDFHTVRHLPIRNESAKSRFATQGQNWFFWKILKDTFTNGFNSLMQSNPLVKLTIGIYLDTYSIFFMQ